MTTFHSRSNTEARTLMLKLCQLYRSAWWKMCVWRIHVLLVLDSSFSHFIQWTYTMVDIQQYKTCALLLLVLSFIYCNWSVWWRSVSVNHTYDTITVYFHQHLLLLKFLPFKPSLHVICVWSDLDVIHLHDALGNCQPPT